LLTTLRTTNTHNCRIIGVPTKLIAAIETTAASSENVQKAGLDQGVSNFSSLATGKGIRHPIMLFYITTQVTASISTILREFFLYHILLLRLFNLSLENAAPSAKQSLYHLVRQLFQFTL
jgi:hypothetical protein